MKSSDRTGLEQRQGSFTHIQRKTSSRILM